MTVSSQTNIVHYTGDGTTTAFAFPMQFFSPLFDLDLSIWNTTTWQASGGHLNGGGTYDYTVTGTQDPNTGEYLSGATVTFNTAPPAGSLVIFIRQVQALQPVALTDNTPFPAKSFEGALDRRALVEQLFTYEINQCVQFPVCDRGLISILPPAALRAGNVLTFDAQGQVCATFSAAGLGGGNIVGGAGIMVSGNVANPTITNSGIITLVAGANTTIVNGNTIVTSGSGGGGGTVVASTNITVTNGNTIATTPTLTGTDMTLTGNIRAALLKMYQNSVTGAGMVLNYGELAFTSGPVGSAPETMILSPTGMTASSQTSSAFVQINKGGITVNNGVIELNGENFGSLVGNVIGGAGVSVTGTDLQRTIVNTGVLSLHAGANMTLTGGTTTTGNVAGVAITLTGSAGGGGSGAIVNGGSSTGTNTITATASGFTLSAGNGLAFIAGGNNTASATLNVNAGGAKTIEKPGAAGPVTLTGGEIVTGNAYVALYDGTEFQLIGGLANMSTAAQQELNPANSTSAYTSGMVVGGSQDFNAAARSGGPGTGRVTSLVIGDAANQNVPIDCYFFNVPKASLTGAYTDHGNAAFSNADLAALVGIVHVEDWTSDGAAAKGVGMGVAGLPLPFALGAANTTLSMVAVVRGAPTWAASGDLYFILGVDRD